ncbi:uncharacterized protein LOC131852726 [Achroia grisella]|uniref:uncharacterized protein LOC131852726 n=1 Tax=Achroia grisella TaxID=688607 RepID=UPI0027D23A8F|nr:uncharacterized protein LOC131852726 [Achroia grisella]
MSNPTVEQVHTLLTFLAEHQELARGHCRNAEGRTRSTQLWVRLTDELNALGGCTKTVKQWQKVWADKKYLTKKAATAARRSATATGVGQSSAVPLNPIQCRILGIMGEGFGEPQSDAHVPAFPENFNGYYTSSERRRRRAAIGPRSIRRRLFEMEERRIAAEDRRVVESGLIRQSLQELNVLIRDRLDGLQIELRRLNS